MPAWPLLMLRRELDGRVEPASDGSWLTKSAMLLVGERVLDVLRVQHGERRRRLIAVAHDARAGDDDGALFAVAAGRLRGDGGARGALRRGGAGHRHRGEADPRKEHCFQ